MRWTINQRIDMERRPCPDEGNDPTDSQTKELNKMKVKQEYLAELRVTFLASVRDVENQDAVLAELVKYLPKEGEVSLSDFIQTEYFDIFEHLFEEVEKSASELVKEKLQQLWKDVELADFAILNVEYLHQDDIDDDANPQELFSFEANELEILIDEADMKMQKFKKSAEAILGFPMKYDFDDTSTEGVGNVTDIYGSAA